MALVHHWLVRMRGGEKVLEALCQLFPQADVYTLVFDPSQISDVIKDHSIKASVIQKLPFASRYYRYYLPLFPLAVEQFDLSGYDLVISSDAAVCKGVLTNPETCHICYCHSPMRYAWSAYHTYLHSIPGYCRRQFFSWVMNHLRSWDAGAALRVDYFLANSQNVARRIHKYYRREASVIYPPIAVGDFRPAQRVLDHFLIAGELVPYKRVDLAVEAFNACGHPLLVVGDGPEYSNLKKRAKGNIRFAGRVPDAELRLHLSQCRALVLPGEEDFGMIVVEAHACGRPVIALGRGGALETVTPGLDGIFFADETAASLGEALRRFESAESSFQPSLIRQGARAFDQERFKQEIGAFVAEKMDEQGQFFKTAPHKWLLQTHQH